MKLNGLNSIDPKLTKTSALWRLIFDFLYEIRYLNNVCKRVIKHLNICLKRIVYRKNIERKIVPKIWTYLGTKIRTVF